MLYHITKSTGAQWILKPKYVLPWEFGGLGFLIIMRAGTSAHSD